MQKLHLVGFTADNDGLIFSVRKGAKTGSFVVPLDAKLLQQVAEADRRRNGGPARTEAPTLPRLVRPESALSPREMQDRIRAGWSLEEVAAAAGVDLDWVGRFAAPVLAEVRQVLEQARALRYDKPRFGESALPLGAAVRRNVLERGVRLLGEELDGGWSAYHLDGDHWVVRFAYVSRGRSQEAEWLFDAATGDLASRNRLGAQLGHVNATRSRRPARSAVPKPARPVAKKSTSPAAAEKVAAERPGARKASSARAGSRKPASTKAARPAVAPNKAAPRAKAGPAKKVAPPTSRKSAAKRSGSEARKAPRKKPGKEPAPAATRAAGRAFPHPPADVVQRLVSGPARQRTPDQPVDPRRPRWTAPEDPVGPPPAPSVPVAEPDAARDAVTRPIAGELEPRRAGVVAVDPQNGIARIDSRRNSHYGSLVPSRRPEFRDDVSRAAADAPPPRPRRREPLRGR